MNGNSRDMLEELNRNPEVKLNGSINAENKVNGKSSADIKQNGKSSEEIIVKGKQSEPESVLFEAPVS